MLAFFQGIVKHAYDPRIHERLQLKYIVCALLGNDVEHLKVSRQQRELSFNVSRPGSVQPLHRGCSYGDQLRVAEGETPGTITSI